MPTGLRPGLGGVFHSGMLATGVRAGAAALQFPLAHAAVEIALLGPQDRARWDDGVAMLGLSAHQRPLVMDSVARRVYRLWCRMASDTALGACRAWDRRLLPGLDTMAEIPRGSVMNAPLQLNAASMAHFAAPCGYIGQGGTIPLMNLLERGFPRAQMMVCGVLGPRSNAHGPNEFLHVPFAKKLTAAVARVIVSLP